MSTNLSLVQDTAIHSTSHELMKATQQYEHSTCRFPFVIKESGHVSNAHSPLVVLLGRDLDDNVSDQQLLPCWRKCSSCHHACKWVCNVRCRKPYQLMSRFWFLGTLQVQILHILQVAHAQKRSSRYHSICYKVVSPCYDGLVQVTDV